MQTPNAMSPMDRVNLALGLAATAEVLGQSLTPEAIELMVDDLSCFSLPVVTRALTRCRRELRTKFTLGAIMDAIESEDGRPSPDEAWSLARQAHDESSSVALTQEIALAMSASQDAMADGDRIGARRSFLDTYSRLADKARVAGEPVQWFVSFGHDPRGRERAVEEAIRLGRIGQEKAAHYRALAAPADKSQALPDPRIAQLEAHSRAMSPVLALLPAPGEITRAPRQGHEQLQAIRELLGSKRGQGVRP